MNVNEFFWITLCFYLMLWVIGGYFLWKAYRLGIRNDLRHAKGPSGQLLKHRRKFAKSIAVTELLTGLSVIALAVSIPLLTIEMRAWPPFILVIGMSRLSRLISLARQDET
jgi:hypothetical protein